MSRLTEMAAPAGIPYGFRKDPRAGARHSACFQKAWMRTPEDEERRLRSVALQNANTILLARQRAERELAGERRRSQGDPREK